MNRTETRIAAASTVADLDNIAAEIGGFNMSPKNHARAESAITARRSVLAPPPEPTPEPAPDKPKRAARKPKSNAVTAVKKTAAAPKKRVTRTKPADA